MGLTWIDHDTIEKPIEEITLGTDEAVDIEFKVETLKSAQANSTNETIKKNFSKKVMDKTHQDTAFCVSEPCFLRTRPPRFDNTRVRFYEYITTAKWNFFQFLKGKFSVLDKNPLCSKQVWREWVNTGIIQSNTAT